MSFPNSNALLLASAFLLLAPSAKAAALQVSLAGTALSVDSPCARHVQITPDGLLAGKVVVQASAEHQEEIERLLLETGEAAKIHTRPGGCFHPDPDFKATLVLTVTVPASFALDIDESGAGSYDIGAVGGPLGLDVSGAADVHAGRASNLDIDLSGAGSIRIDAAGGAGSVDMSGVGNVSIGQAAMPSLSVDLSGAGQLLIDGGTIGDVSLNGSGVGGIGIGASVGNADVDVSGVGSVKFTKVTGTLDRTVSGVGSVSVGQ